MDLTSFHVKEWLQRLAAASQFFPFTSLYRWLYELAVRLCVRRWRRLPGVRSIYLRRGLAGGRPLYGLSDIDLLVMVEPDPQGRAAARVRYHYEGLRRLIPMLAAGELALYTPEQFRRLHRYSPFYRQRFEEGRGSWRRLWGEDLFRDLPPPAAGETRCLRREELHPAWGYLAQELAPRDHRPAYLRRYVAHKCLADAALAALAAQGDEGEMSREEALERAAGKFPEIASTLRAAAGWRRHLLWRGPLPVDDLLQGFIKLARTALAVRPGMGELQRRLRLLPAPPEMLSLALDAASLEALDRVVGEIQEVERAVLVPRLSFEAVAELGLDPAAYAGATVDAFDLALVGPRLPEASQLRRLNAFLETLRPRVRAFFCLPEMGLALASLQEGTVKEPAGAPEFFASLSNTRPLLGRVEVGTGVEVERPFFREDALTLRAQTFAALYRQAEVYRLPLTSFLALFWEAGRAAGLAAQAQKPVIQVPVASSQVVETLVELTPEAAPVLRQMYGEYDKEVRGLPSELNRYAHWAGEYAARLGAASIDLLGLPDPARTALTLSVLIITRNRAELLKAALTSLAAQERPPDQVVVVDNASSDATPEVARSFAPRLPLTLIREERIGIPYARNTGLQHCTGEVVAIMDDDCVAAPRWLAELELPFLKNPHIGAVGGSVEPLPGQEELVARFYDSRMGSKNEAS